MNYKVEEQAITKFLESRWIVAVAVLVLVVKIMVVAPSINFPKNIFFADITKSALLNFVNQGREQAGLAALSENEKLDQAAQLKAQDMLNNGYFYHVSPSGTTPWHWFSAVGYNYKYAGENLAIGFVDSKEVYNAWYNSAGHKENILNPNYKEVGTAVLPGFGTNKAVIVVQLFGTERPPVAQTLPREQNYAQKNTEQNNSGQNITRESKLVLAQSTESETGHQTYIKYLSMLAYNYEEILQNIIYGFIALTASALMLNFFVNSGAQKKKLMFRAFVILLVLLATALITKYTAAQIIPHKITI